MSHDLNHVAIIMDGNNRWAKSKGLSSKEGHKEGVKKAKNIAYKKVKKMHEIVGF